jgi:ribosomal protein S25
MNSNFFDLSKRKKSDLLSDLLDDKVSEGIVSKKELNSLNKILGTTPQTSPSLKKQQKKTKKTISKKKKKESKKEITHYLTEDVCEKLDSVSKEIKTIVPEKLQASVSRSQIVNNALTMVLKDYKKRGKKSLLFRYIMHNN